MGMNLELESFENRMQEVCLLYILVVTGCARDTGLVVNSFFKGASIHPTHL